MIGVNTIAAEIIAYHSNHVNTIDSIDVNNNNTIINGDTKVNTDYNANAIIRINTNSTIDVEINIDHNILKLIMMIMLLFQ